MCDVAIDDEHFIFLSQLLWLFSLLSLGIDILYEIEFYEFQRTKKEKPNEFKVYNIQMMRKKKKINIRELFILKEPLTQNPLEPYWKWINTSNSIYLRTRHAIQFLGIFFFLLAHINSQQINEIFFKLKIYMRFIYLADTISFHPIKLSENLINIYDIHLFFSKLFIIHWFSHWHKSTSFFVSVFDTQRHIHRRNENLCTILICEFHELRKF